MLLLLLLQSEVFSAELRVENEAGDIVSHLRHLSHLSQDKTKLLFSFLLILFNYAIQGKFIT